MSARTSLRAALFDVDGVIVDTEEEVLGCGARSVERGPGTFPPGSRTW